MIWQHFHKVLHVTLFTVHYFPCDVGRSRNFYGRGTRPTACLQLIFPSFLAVPRYLVVNARPFKGWCTGVLNFITVSKPRQLTVPWVFVTSSGSRASTILVSHTAISRKVVKKSASDNPERHCGWFWVLFYSKKLERIGTKGHGSVFASAKGKQQK